MIALRGKMDIPGTETIALRFSIETTIEKANIIIDLSGVEYMASVGIGVLMQSFKALQRRGGKMALLNPQTIVNLVLVSTHIDTVVPIFTDLQTASDALLNEPSGNKLA
jgi:anti-anti-sigma factor